MPLILIGHFLPIKLIGNGGFGRTFLAMDLHSFERRICVIKQLHPLIPPRTPSELQRIETLFEQEARVLDELRHRQIPKGLGFRVEKVPAGIFNTQQNFFYLAQEYIEGKNLAQELNQRGRFSESEVIDFLTQILNVLHYIHTTPILSNTEGIIHRDIKPHNIIFRHSDNNFFLIDFGAVKQIIVAGVPSESSCVLGAPLYTPPEQRRQEAVSPSSDLYSLAATSVCLLTGRPGGELRHEDTWNWRDYADLSNTNRLAEILDMMLLEDPRDRFQSAQEVIDTLHPTPETGENGEPTTGDGSPPPDKTIPQWPWGKYAFLAVLALVFVFVIHYLSFRPCLKYSCTLDDGFSLGEEVLIKDGSSDPKNAGTEAFKEGNYKKAINSFLESLNKNSNDPESLIYLNNAIAADMAADKKKNRKLIKIASSIPIKFTGNSELSQISMRGVAQAQSEFNCKSFEIIVNAIKNSSNKNSSNNLIETCIRETENEDNLLLQVEIADESNVNQGNVAKKKIQDVADKLKHQDDILGVIGHSSSTSTAYAAEIFNNELVFISSDSTVVRKDDHLNLYKYNYLFRTSPTDVTAASNLVKYIVNNITSISKNTNKNQINRKVVIVQDQTEYSHSFANEFKYITDENNKKNQEKVFNNNNIQFDVVNCNVSSQPACSIEDTFKKVKPDIILLSFNIDTLLQSNSAIFDNQSTAKVILGSDGVYHPSILTNFLNNKRIDKKLVFAIPWHKSNKKESASTFEKNFEKLWKEDEIHWRTAMAYDATKAISAGIKELGAKQIVFTRRELYNVLSDANFQVDEGAAGQPIKFDERGDRKLYEGIGVLVRVQYNQSNNKYEFVTLDN